VFSMKMETLQSLVERLPDFGTRPALGLRQFYGLRWWDYNQLYQAVLRFAALLRDRRIAPGNRILVWAADCPEWTSVLLGAVIRGVILVPIDENMSASFVKKIAAETEAVMVIHGLDQDITGLESIAFNLFQIAELTFPMPEIETLIVPVTPDDIVMILYTSGTTSNPKGVLISHRNITYQISTFDQWGWLAKLYPWRILMLSPLSHIQGLLFGIFIPLAMGLSVIYSDTVDPAQVIRIIKQNRVTLLLAVPRLQHLIAQELARMRYGRERGTLAEKVSAIRFFPYRRHILFLQTHARLGYWFYILLVGGANLPPTDEEFWFECGYILVQGYGLTETTGLVSVNISNPFRRRLGSIGKPLPGQNVTLGQDNEVLVRGPNVTPGFYKRPGVYRDSLKNGALHTGDLARFDEHNQLFFLDRKKEVIVTSEGMNIYPHEVEELLNQIPGVRDSVVIGVAEDDLTEVHAVILLDEQIELSQVKNAADRLLESHQKIRSWTVWPGRDFPRTGLLKVKRDEVMGSLSRRDLTSPASPDSSEEDLPDLDTILLVKERQTRLELFSRFLTSTKGREDLPGDIPLIDQLGLSSLDLIELTTLMETKLGNGFNRLSITPRMTIPEFLKNIQSGTYNQASPRLPVRQPGWSEAFLGRLVRLVTQPLLIGLWSEFSTRIQVHWVNGQPSLNSPFIIAGAPHRHWLDGFILYRSLPWNLRHRAVTVTNRNFHEYFEPTPDIPPRLRRTIGLVYYLLWPLVFDFIIVPNYGLTREGLFELGRAIDKGKIPITFPKGLSNPNDPTRHEPGVATLALQTERQILPAWIEGNQNLRVKPSRTASKVNLYLGEPIQPRPSLSVEKLVEQVEAAFDQLAEFARLRA
jgi:long-chain acyl-CoA synthetase